MADCPLRSSGSSEGGPEASRRVLEGDSKKIRKGLEGHPGPPLETRRGLGRVCEWAWRGLEWLTKAPRGGVPEGALTGTRKKTRKGTRRGRGAPPRAVGTDSEEFPRGDGGLKEGARRGLGSHIHETYHNNHNSSYRRVITVSCQLIERCPSTN